MSKLTKRLLAPAVLAAVALPVANAPVVDATPAINCRVAQYRVLMGIDFGPLHTRRICKITTGDYVAGSSNLASNTSTVTTGAGAARQLVVETTVHELTHQVDWRTSNAYRTKLYAFLGYRSASGTFWSIPSPAARWNGKSLAVWKADPHERLAESVVQCAGGTPRVSGMRLVPKAQCSAFLATYKAALKAVR